MVTIIDHGSWTLRPEDEHLHQPGPETLWNESYYFDFASADGSLGGYIRLGLYPNWNRAWYWACLVGEGRPLVLISDNLAPLPVPGHGGPDGTGARLVTPGAGYTAVQEITDTLQEARLTLESSAAAVLADPLVAYEIGTDRAEAVDDGAGTPPEVPVTPFGFDLRWSTAGGVYPYRDMSRYEIPCEVTGTIRVGDEEIAFTGYGERDHSWGERDWWSLSWLWTAGRLTDGTAFHGVQANLGLPFPWPSFVVPPGAAIEHRDGFHASSGFAADGLPAASAVGTEGLAVRVEPARFAPVAMTSPDGRTARFPRALCRFESEDGRAGYGWTEWHQPPGWTEHDWSGTVAAANEPTAANEPAAADEPTAANEPAAATATPDGAAR